MRENEDLNLPVAAGVGAGAEVGGAEEGTEPALGVLRGALAGAAVDASDASATTSTHMGMRFSPFLSASSRLSFTS
jgi:hypothetical protein